MRFVLVVIATCCSFALFPQNNWTQLPDFPGFGRDAAFEFAWDSDGDGNTDKGFVGAGWNSQGTTYTDFYEFDPSTNLWTQLANYPGLGTRGAVAFVRGNTAYIVGGAYGASSLSAQVWAYNIVSDTWSRKNDLPIAVYGGEIINIDGDAYYVCGNLSGSISNPTLNNRVYKYIESTDTWVATNNSIPFSGRFLGVKVEVDIDNDGVTDRAFIGCGTSRIGVPLSDFWEYLPATDSWVARTVVPGPDRGMASSFSIGSKGYVGIGRGEFASADLYEYDPFLDTWTRMSDHPGTPTLLTSSFTIGNEGYVVAGKTTNTGGVIKQAYKFSPLLSGTPELKGMDASRELRIFPNPVAGLLNIVAHFPVNEQVEVTVIDMLGRAVMSQQYNGIKGQEQTLIMDVTQLPTGIYLVSIIAEGKFATARLIKE